MAESDEEASVSEYGNSSGDLYIPVKIRKFSDQSAHGGFVDAGIWIITAVIAGVAGNAATDLLKKLWTYIKSLKRDALAEAQRSYVEQLARLIIAIRFDVEPGSFYLGDPDWRDGVWTVSFSITASRAGYVVITNGVDRPQIYLNVL